MTAGIPTTRASLMADTRRIDGCLIWQGRSRVGPYGSVSFEGQRWLVHRLSYFLATGQAPAVVRHDCDTPLCIEPNHLLPGDHIDNVDDKVRRERHLFHDRHPMAKLTSADVAAIRSRVAASEQQKTLALEYHVSQTQVSKIVRRRRWTEPGGSS